MKHENLLKKYDLTEEQLMKGIDVLSNQLGNIVDFNVVMALADLLASGDIKE